MDRRRAAADSAGARIEPWIARSWQRCLAAGHRPQQRVSFDPVSRAAARAPRRASATAQLVTAARPVLDRLSRAIADTRYFAILTDADGIVVDVGALPGGSDAAARHARDIARIGVDLSERAVGTTAIGAALAEQRVRCGCTAASTSSTTPASTAAPARRCSAREGDCVGMLDLTGVHVVERPELQAPGGACRRAASRTRWCCSTRCELLLHLDWPG